MRGKLSIFTLLVIASLPASADYVPGRTRASAAADCSYLEGEGPYREIQSARIVQYQTDGKGITKFTIELNHKDLLTLPVRSIFKNRCGRTFLAKTSKNPAFPDDPESTLRIDEISVEACRGAWPIEWRASLETETGGKEPSRLTLRGKAEYFLLSQ